MLEFTYLDNLFLILAEMYLSYRIIRYSTTKGISLLTQEVLLISYLLRGYYLENYTDNVACRWSHLLVLGTILFNIFLLRLPFRKDYLLSNTVYSDSFNLFLIIMIGCSLLSFGMVGYIKNSDFLVIFASSLEACFLIPNIILFKQEKHAPDYFKTYLSLFFLSVLSSALLSIKNIEMNNNNKSWNLFYTNLLKIFVLLTFLIQFLRNYKNDEDDIVFQMNLGKYDKYGTIMTSN